ncbi:MAG: hypothetical protein ACU88J_15825 [Gammaproteobacteria bacterium]
MARWLIEVQGDRFDIDELPYWFPDGDLYAISEGKNVLICGPALESLENAAQVYKVAEQAMTEFFSIIKLIQPIVNLPKLGTVFREDENGQRKGTDIGSAHLVTRSKLRATVTANSSEHGTQKPTQAQELLVGSHCDRGLQVATLLISAPNSSWPHFYRAFEEIKRYVEKCTGNNIVKVGLCLKQDEIRFRHTANNADIAGNDARHRFDYSPQIPDNPMSADEARTFISKLLQSTLRLAVENEKTRSLSSN